MKILLVHIAIFIFSFEAMAQGQNSKLIAKCVSDTPEETISVCLYKQPWTQNTDQYITQWDLKKDCQLNNGGHGFHQFIGKDIRKVSAKILVLRESYSFLGLCKNRWTLKLNLENGDARFSAKTANCNFLPVFGLPNFTEPEVRKTNLKCSLIKN